MKIAKRAWKYYQLISRRNAKYTQDTEGSPTPNGEFTCSSFKICLRCIVLEYQLKYQRNMFRDTVPPWILRIRRHSAGQICRKTNTPVPVWKFEGLWG
ncbi:hypothetical protein AVEN_152922-1 [Araneus ventricosus]|uniref:Uncharacterized protein n=1 Tax=Araneus ventricosus TaxID=182803 RepID=A0A4Y2AD01_ARAVE|nr:hypothetical protein AVEN_152922-1 [Araneus ventricosus]